MAEHEPCIGASDEWYTPPEIFAALGLEFDLDPCAPLGIWERHRVPAMRFFTKEDDGLAQEWHGRVFMNPPFGGRNGHIPWLKKFIAHGNGIAIVRAYTSSGWWHDWMPMVDMVLFPRSKTKFIRPDGSIGKSPGHGIALLAMGEACCESLKHSGLGMVWDLKK